MLLFLVEYGILRLRIRIIVMIETERIIANVNATLAMGGMTLTATDKIRIRYCIEGRKTFEEIDINQRANSHG